VYPFKQFKIISNKYIIDWITSYSRI
jgi:hypothetical protein